MMELGYIIIIIIITCEEHGPKIFDNLPPATCLNDWSCSSSPFLVWGIWPDFPFIAFASYTPSVVPRAA